MKSRNVFHQPQESPFSKQSNYIFNIDSQIPAWIENIPERAAFRTAMPQSWKAVPAVPGIRGSMIRHIMLK